MIIPEHIKCYLDSLVDGFSGGKLHFNNSMFKEFLECYVALRTRYTHQSQFKECDYYEDKLTYIAKNLDGSMFCNAFNYSEASEYLNSTSIYSSLADTEFYVALCGYLASDKSNARIDGDLKISIDINSFDPYLIL